MTTLTMTNSIIQKADAITDIIKKAKGIHHLSVSATAQCYALKTQQSEYLRASMYWRHDTPVYTPKPVMWSNHNFDFEYELDGSITLSFYNDDDTSLVFTAESEITANIEKGCGFVAFDDLIIKDVVIYDADEKAYRAHISKEVAADILETYICSGIKGNKIEHSTSLAAMEESAADNASYHANPNAYYGMSSNDYSIKASKVRKESNADYHDNAYTHYGKNT
jgi:hypothetical protein